MPMPFPIGFWKQASTAAADPQLRYFENFEGHLFGVNANAFSNGTLSVHAVMIPLSISFGNVVFPMSISSGGADKTFTYHFGLYSLNGVSLSLANSASRSFSATSNLTVQSWLSMATSATQNISPGNWWFAFNALSAGNSSMSIYGASSVGWANVNPVAIRGRFSASTNAMPVSMATADLDLTGSDTSRQPYILVTA